uniref:Uncharacterized protein n=1 Tax=Oryza meridionalis TaxID=40149 RepID=A0A0E0DNA5_9ORYZ
MSRIPCLASTSSSSPPLRRPPPNHPPLPRRSPLSAPPSIPRGHLRRRSRRHQIRRRGELGNGGPVLDPQRHRAVQSTAAASSASPPPRRPSPPPRRCASLTCHRRRSRRVLLLPHHPPRRPSPRRYPLSPLPSIPRRPPSPPCSRRRQILLHRPNVGRAVLSANPYAPSAAISERASRSYGAAVNAAWGGDARVRTRQRHGIDCPVTRKLTRSIGSFPQPTYMDNAVSSTSDLLQSQVQVLQSIRFRFCCLHFIPSMVERLCALFWTIYMSNVAPF